ncbi:MAG: beta-ketoacyl-ACP synthase II [Bdellovibrionaceae bacterium]|nr:beta-ketoacyl-ACP synthase II [Pseudobdellovibrionaceae bacterium]
MSKKRIVITGQGVLSPVGNTLATFWDNLIQGKSGITNITQCPTDNLKVKIAGEVKNFNPDEVLNKKDQKKVDRFILLGLGSATQAIADSQLQFSDEQVIQETGIILGVGLGGLPTIEKQAELYFSGKRVSPFFIPSIISNLLPGQISLKYPVKGPQFTTASACASGAHAIITAANYIQQGLCNRVITGGSESTICHLAMEGFASMKALSTNNENPQEASCPWDNRRDGFVLSEGSASLIVEDLDTAIKRKAPIYAELVGWGMSADAYHITSPQPKGDGAALAMKLALQQAQISPHKVDYINAHGTSTPMGDAIETQAIKTVFKDHAHKLMVSSTKGAMGHTLGAAGAIESLVCIKSLETQTLPCTLNLKNPSEDCDLDYIPNQSRETKVNYVLNNSFGFGGTNASLIFKKY